MTKAIGYIRVSTKAQGQNGYGLDAQRVAIERFCEREGIELLTVIPDVMSGRKTDKLYGRAAALAAIKAGLADVLVLKDFDRATRDTRDGLDLMLNAKAEGWRVLTTKGEDTDTIGEFELTVKLAFATEERKRISERTKAGLERASVHGTRSGKPIGRKSQIDRDVVERIVSLSADGLGAKAIANRLTEAHVPTPAGGARWHYSTVRGVLAREAVTA